VVPEELKYTPEHEWVAQAGAGVVRVGITDYAATQLGDVVFVSLPAVGEQITAGQPVGEIESTKSVSDLFAPVAGEIVARNDDLDNDPALVNSDAYSAWMMEIKLADPAEMEGLLSAAQYQKLTGEE
jgi:glycine cleavage system H protein